MAVDIDRAKSANGEIERISDGIPATIVKYDLRGDKPFLVVDHEIADDIAAEYTEMELHTKYTNAPRKLDVYLTWWVLTDGSTMTDIQPFGAPEFIPPETNAKLLDSAEIHLKEQVAIAAEQPTQ